MTARTESDFAQMALSAVTDAYGKGPEHAERMRGVTKVIVSMLRTWSGSSQCPRRCKSS